MFTGAVGKVLAGIVGLFVVLFVTGTGIGRSSQDPTGAAVGTGRDAQIGYGVRLRVEETGRLTGTVTITTARDTLEEDWGSEEAFFAEADRMLPFYLEDADPTDTFRKDGRVGKEYAFRDIPPERFATSGMLHSFEIKHFEQENRWRLEGRLRMTPDSPKAASVIGTSARASIRFTFPGRVEDGTSRGVRDDEDPKTVVFTPRFGEDYTVTARADDGSQWPPDWGAVLSALLFFLVLAALAALIGWAVLRQQRNERAG